jgi:hypothetical protein
MFETRDPLFLERLKPSFEQSPGFLRQRGSIHEVLLDVLLVLLARARAPRTRSASC